MLLSEELLKEYVELFRGKSEAELDELVKSFLLCMSVLGESGKSRLADRNSQLRPAGSTMSDAGRRCQETSVRLNADHICYSCCFVFGRKNKDLIGCM